jgi:ABC-type transport system substrate-binding protein
MTYRFATSGRSQMRLGANYWQRILDRRVQRRRVLASAGGVGLSAMFIVACGGDSDTGGPSSASGSSGSGGAETSGFLHKATDTTQSAQRGGTWRGYLASDPLNFDLLNFDPFTQPFANVVGSKLVKAKPGHLEDAPLDVIPDIAQSWEYSPDKLTLTFKLNPAAKWSPLSSSFHQGAPSSIANRPFDADDVLFSWQRFLTTPTASGRDELANGVQPTAPVEGLSAPDQRTVVMHMVRPNAAVLPQLGNGSVSYFYLFPKEGVDGSVDFFKYQFGGGPFYIDSFEPSVKMVLKRNPNYEALDPEFKRPYVDQVDLPVIPDISQVVAQFRAGNLLYPSAGGLPTNPAVMTLEEVLQTKEDLPETQVVGYQGSDNTLMWFGMAPDGPWKDVRVRQAMSYAWDRDGHIDALFGVQELEDAGIPPSVRWNAAMNCSERGINASFAGWWLDPRSPDFGEESKYFTLGDRKADLTEAKRLLSAAGFPDGIDFETHYVNLSAFQGRSRDLMEGIIAEAGFRSKLQKEIKYPEVFNYINGGGNFKELWNGTDFGGPDPASYYRVWFHNTGSLFGGYSPDDKGVNPQGDQFLNNQVEKLFAEFDVDRRIDLSNELIRYVAKMNYKARHPGGATQLAITWPAVQNLDVWRGYGLSGAFAYEWLDTTKEPFV